MNARIHKTAAVTTAISAVFFIILVSAVPGVIRRAYLSSRETALEGWMTNTSKKLISLEELCMPGPIKDDIPAIDIPLFVDINDASSWITPAEPVLSLVINGRAKAYPLQILIWHGVVNDYLQGIPVAVTFCPLSYSPAVYERTIKGRILEFGVSGMLRNSNMIMYDTTTQTLWQHFTGNAIVGDFTPVKLRSISSQLISFEEFSTGYPAGTVLSRDTGFMREYGLNPYVGYDCVSNVPFMFTGTVDARLSPMEKVISINIKGAARSYPDYMTKSRGVINDYIAGTPIAIFHTNGMVSALDRQWIKNSRLVGSTGVFSRCLGDYELTFTHIGEHFVDEQTRTVWDITGKAIKGRLLGEHLKPVNHKNSFAFIWLVFNPAGEIYR